jgi:DNA-binding Lrp family transcriptional regulator
MVVPSRKNQMIKQLMRNKKHKIISKKIKSKQITEEEHKERIRKLKEMGILK